MKIFRNIIAGVIMLTAASFACAQTLYKIESVNSGKVLDVGGASMDNGAWVQQWDFHGGAQQLWTLEDAGNGAYIIRNVNSGKVLDVDGGSSDGGARVHQWDYLGDDNEQWWIEDVGEGIKVIRSVRSGLVLDIEGGSQENGVGLYQWGYYGDANQQWRLIELPPPPPPPTCDSVTNSGGLVSMVAFEVYANNVQNASRVVFPTWTDANGQDELIWYEGEYDAANNRWIRLVNLYEHHFESGSYTTHAYALGADNQWYILGGTNVTIAGPFPPLVPLYRLYGGGNFDHFYTADHDEVMYAIACGYYYEGIACYVETTGSNPGTVPLYRYWHTVRGQHFYTTDWSELGAGSYEYVYERIECYVYAEKQNPFIAGFHRLYNSSRGGHLLTIDPYREKVWAYSVDYKLQSPFYDVDKFTYEGVQFYVYPYLTF